MAGVEATPYLESKGVVVVLSPSDFMAKTKLSFRGAAETGHGFRVPGNIKDKFPKIVKYADGMASLAMESDSVCYAEEALAKMVELLKSKEPGREIVIQDFIRGIETTAIVVEMGSEVVALLPVDWVFPEDTPVDKVWLTSNAKFESLGEGSIRLDFVTEEPRRSRICSAAAAAFKALGMQGHGAWGRLDVRVDGETGEVYCLEMNHMPALFYGPDDKLSDDVIIRGNISRWP